MNIYYKIHLYKDIFSFLLVDKQISAHITKLLIITSNPSQNLYSENL